MRSFSSDRLSPILVKELRQGIRSKLFLGAFLVIQLLLFLYGSTVLMVDRGGVDSSLELTFFWTALILPMVFLVPALASQGIEKEISGNTLELLLLTRISSYRLVLGKWASVIVQTTLLVTSALPYLMLRYFLGGIDIWGELRALAVLVLASSLLAGITMGFWATKVSKLIKWGAVFAFLWLGPYLFMVLMASRGGLGGTGPGVGLATWVYAFIAMLMMLALAASRIGPPAENHSTQIRILALAALAAGLVFRGSRDLEALSAMFAVMILAPTLIGCLTEEVRGVPRLYAPFLKKTGPVRWLQFPFSPGWPGGVAFSGLVLTLTPWFPVWAGEFRPDVFVAVAATFLFPAAIVRTALRPDRQSLPFYLLTLIVLTVPLYVWGAARAFDNATVAFVTECVAGLFPPVALALELGQPSGYAGTAAALEGLLVVVWSLIALTRRARSEWEKLASLTRSRPEPSPSRAAAPAVEGSLP